MHHSMIDILQKDDLSGLQADEYALAQLHYWNALVPPWTITLICHSIQHLYSAGKVV